MLSRTLQGNHLSCTWKNWISCYNEQPFTILFQSVNSAIKLENAQATPNHRPMRQPQQWAQLPDLSRNVRPTWCTFHCQWITFNCSKRNKQHRQRAATKLNRTKKSTHMNIFNSSFFSDGKNHLHDISNDLSGFVSTKDNLKVSTLQDIYGPKLQHWA